MGRLRYSRACARAAGGLFTAGALAVIRYAALAHSFVGAAAHQGRCDRARQQDRENGVGPDGQR